MKLAAAMLAALLCCDAALAQHNHHVAATSPPPVALMPGLGEFHFPVRTSNAEAQRFFDQGMILLYGFNHAEAERSFRRAAELDPKLAMAHWGVAMAVGPNYNETSIAPDRVKTAHEAVRRGLALAADGPERNYLETLAKRYSADPSADQPRLWSAYRDAARELMRLYPDDLDAATLFADAAMILNAWKLWSPSGVPAEGTEEIVSVLEMVIARDPTHIGAHHLYIHAVEASPHPEWALASADRLGGLSPAAGHLVHMPAHIYMRVGDYANAAKSNEFAAKVDEQYLERGGLRGIYTAAYYSHNLHFLAAAHSMQGRYADAVAAARRLETNIRPYLVDMPFFESFLPTAPLIMVRFGKWDEVLREPKPDASLRVTTAFWHWWRGMAHAATGRMADAQADLDELKAATSAIAPEAGYGQNTARSVLAIADHFLRSRIAWAKGDRKTAIDHLRRAVEAEDALAYDEPPGWYHPLSREALGGALLLDGKSEEAAAVLREDLRRNRANARSLFGLLKALEAQGKAHEAGLVRRQFERAWKNADTTLTVESL